MRMSAALASLGVVGLTLGYGITGCGGLRSDPGGTAARVSEVTLRASPTPGMRASYEVSTSAALSGAGVRSLPTSERSASVSQRYLIEVTGLGVEIFDLRVT